MALLWDAIHFVILQALFTHGSTHCVEATSAAVVCGSPWSQSATSQWFRYQVCGQVRVHKVTCSVRPQTKWVTKEEEDENLAQTSRSTHHLCDFLSLSQQRLNPSNLAYSPDVGRTAGSASLISLVSMPAVLVTRHTVTQNSPFLPEQWLQPWPVLTVPTRRGLARLSGNGWLI